jgi:DNA-directed RNA polymerase specialized sigma subunit
MTAKEYLTQTIWLNKSIDSKLEYLESLKQLTMKVTASYSQDKPEKKQQGKKCAMEEALVKVMDLENEVTADIDRLIDLKRGIGEYIRELEDPRHRLILEHRYLNNKSWEEVREIIGFDKRWIYRIHKEALKEIDEKFKIRHSEPL